MWRNNITRLYALHAFNNDPLPSGQSGGDYPEISVCNGRRNLLQMYDIMIINSQYRRLAPRGAVLLPAAEQGVPGCLPPHPVAP